jgi:hypothetical protein
MKNFNYGKYILEYRPIKNGELKFLKKKIDDVDTAMKEAAKLRDLGYDSVTIRTK